jgi:ABC-type Fe3+-hydroxamate transport system substrate-binding protein
MNSKKYITEGLDVHDMEGQLVPTVSIDEYAAKMGKDSDIITLAFIVKSQAAGEDLVDWFERGYDWVLDASLSDGEIEVGKYLVFVEMNRRSSAPGRIVELLSDLETLTNIKVNDWTVTVDSEDYEPDEHVLQQVIILNPNKYTADKEREEELNEMRVLAKIEPKPIYSSNDTELKNFKAMAGL